MASDWIHSCRRDLRWTALASVMPYQAHPAETDTPAETGTSEDGTRQTDTQPNTEE